MHSELMFIAELILHVCRRHVEARISGTHRELRVFQSCSLFVAIEFNEMIRVRCSHFSLHLAIEETGRLNACFNNQSFWSLYFSKPRSALTNDKQIWKNTTKSSRKRHIF